MKTSIGNSFRNMKIYKKLLLTYLIIFLLPVCFTIFFVVPKVAQETVNQSITISQIGFQQLKDNITKQFDDYIRLAANIAVEEELISYLMRPYIEGEAYGEKHAEYFRITQLYSKKYAFSTLDNIKIIIYSKNKNILYGDEFIYSISDQIKDEQWYKNTVAANGDMVITDPFLDERKIYSITISKRIMSREAVNSMNIVRVVIPVALLEDYIKKESLIKDIFIVNQNNEVIVSSSKNATGMKVQSHQLGTVIKSEPKDTSVIDRRDIKGNIVLEGKLGNKPALNGYRIICSISPSIILGKTNGIVRYSAVIYFISILVAVLLIVGFSKTLTGRLAILVKTMKDVKEDDLFVSFYNEDQDEIGELSRSFKNLIHRISTLINEVYIQKMSFQELELKQKETEFLALQSQINPHFLFNTIESIRMNALTNGDLGTSEILERFGKLLRRSFDWSSRFVTLSQEMLLVENYIMIQKFRYSDRFDYHLDIQSELLGIMIPKFIIQPIVENAIAHGLEMKKSGGLLPITVFEQEGKLKIAVVDNGVGMTEERLMEVRQTLQSKDNTSSSSSIGLKNVCQRIRLIYGNEYGVELDSNPITGTKVVITLPMDARVGDQNV